MDKHIAIPGLTDDEQATLDRLVTQLADKAPRNILRASYYDGKRALRQIGTVIPPQYYRLGIVLGWSAKAVDTLADRCNLERFVWPDGDLAAIGASEVFEANSFGAEVAEGIVSALLHGVVFAITTRGGEGEPPALIHFKDALNATGTWNARTRQLDSVLSVTGRDDEGRITGLALYLHGLTIAAERDGSGWQVDRQDHPWGMPVDPLVFRPRSGRSLGTSRVSRAVMSLHDQALRTVIRLEGHMDVYSYPELWLLGADEKIFRNTDGSPKAAWQVMLGRIKGIPDDPDANDPQLARAEVKQFRASDPDPHLAALKQQAQLFSGETSIPLTSLGVSDQSNPVSAESYIASREDLIALAEKTTEDWFGPRLGRVFRRSLAMANGLDHVPPAWSSIAPKWRSPVHLSRAAAADAGAKQLSAVPWLADTEVGLELLGLDEQQVRRAMAERTRQAGRAVVEALARADR